MIALALPARTSCCRTPAWPQRPSPGIEITAALARPMLGQTGLPTPAGSLGSAAGCCIAPLAFDSPAAMTAPETRASLLPGSAASMPAAAYGNECPVGERFLATLLALQWRPGPCMLARSPCAWAGRACDDVRKYAAFRPFGRAIEPVHVRAASAMAVSRQVLQPLAQPMTGQIRITGLQCCLTLPFSTAAAS